MFDLYHNCKMSLVFSSGLQRLTAHDKSTNWIKRSRTLQEAIPKATFIVFRWHMGSGEISGLAQGQIEEIESG